MRKSKLKSILSSILFLTIFLNGTIVSAYNERDILFKNISIKDGLSQATVESILQDSRGYMWFATNDGLNRYNGYNFKVYRKERKSTKGLTSNYISKIIEDKQGFIWASAYGGVNKIDVENETITQYVQGEDKGNISNNNVNDILLTKDGRILIANYSGIDIYNEETDSFESFTNAEKNLKNEVVF